MYGKKAHIHFVGIGGIGMSGIATVLNNQGYEISGCDLDMDQQSVKNLKEIGCHIYHGNNTPQCKDDSIDILVYSSEIRAHHPEIQRAQQRGIPTIPRALMLAELMRTKYSIAIAGSHGKTTTTSLISHILMEAHIDPTIIIGGHLKTISTNARLGMGDFLVAEADESDRSLTRLSPTIAVVTNIDLEHLDTYKDIDDIKATFKQFLNNLPFYGKAIVCIDDPHIRSLLPIAHIKTIKYGLDSSADIYAQELQLHPTYSTFTVWHKDDVKPLGTVQFAMPGRHNALNALAAITVALDIGVDFNTAAHALSTFKGVERRFTYRGTYKGTEIFDDYGHHPQEILNTLLVARKRAKGRLIVAFQPHRYTRTDKLWNDFVKVLTESAIDQLFITDIHAASEAPIPGITAQNLVNAIVDHRPVFPVHYVPYDDHFSTLIKTLEKTIQPDDLVLLLGAGKIFKIAFSLIPEAHYKIKPEQPLPT
ncbi:MAG TPA: UDP-N-acetylmuramate--L-alanine ligase [Candidatus Babeliales bacterium]|nr:UDP-N-acetylmuramate--L-alanine ligase [Candidatus Babeliales bacterium]